MESATGHNFTLDDQTLTVALELAGKAWKISLQCGAQAHPAQHTVEDEGAAQRLATTMLYVQRTRIKWQLPTSSRVVVIYEAGQDGFWIYWALQKEGFEVVVVDPASIPVERQARRAKTDRLDVLRLQACLRGWLRGERERLHAVRIPAPDAEATRHLVRERGLLQKEIGQHRDRMRKLLRTVGCWTSVGANFADQLKSGEIRCHDGVALPQYLRQRLERECERLALTIKQFDGLEAELPKLLSDTTARSVSVLQRLRGIGQIGAQRLVLELFWRQFDNARQVGSCVGLVPQPYDSGQSRVDQGISKQGNRRIRALLIEMAWMWIRHQPRSTLTKWYKQRTGTGITDPRAGKRGKRVCIVAVARRLAIALWRYLELGVLPAGAELKTKVK